MTARHSAYIVSSLLVTIAAALLFVLGTDGFYGTNAPTLWDALHPQRIAQSDDVYLCSDLNGEGSDDAFGAFLVVLLVPSLIVRVLLFRRRSTSAEFMLFCCLSVPALLFHFGVARCADIDLTIIVGRSLPLAALTVGWISALLLLLLPSETSGRAKE